MRCACRGVGHEPGRQLFRDLGRKEAGVGIGQRVHLRVQRGLDVGVVVA